MLATPREYLTTPTLKMTAKLRRGNQSYHTIKLVQRRATGPTVACTSASCQRKRFYPSARWARRGIVVPFVRRRRTHSFGYYTNMVQQIKFIIHTNIQPLPALFHPRSRSEVKGRGQRFKKKSFNSITWKIIFGFLQFFTWSYPWVWRSPDFSFPPIIKMAATWRLNFFRLIFFFIIPLKPGIYRFSGSASLLALFVFACNRKRGYGGHLYFLITKFLVNAITWKIIIGSLQFLCHVAHEYGDDLNWFSAFNRKSEWPPPGD